MLGSTSRRIKLRMASLRLDPKTHPIAGDTRVQLLLNGLRASMREPDLSLRVRRLADRVVHPDGRRADGSRQPTGRARAIGVDSFVRQGRTVRRGQHRIRLDQVGGAIVELSKPRDRIR